MSSESENLEQRRNDDLAFFGKIMANVSHEFNNVITVIGEFSGLLQDLALLAEKGRPIQPEKLQKVTANISRHVARGKELITNMNRFSHSVDEPQQSIDLRETVENMQILTSRLLERRRATLSYQAPESECRLTVDPFAIRQTLFTCLEMAMGASSELPAISMDLNQEANEIRITVSVNAPLSADANGAIKERLNTQLAYLNGEAAYASNENGLHITVTIPKTSDGN